MDIPVFEDPPDENAMVFDLERCKRAPLVCHTPFEDDFRLSFGFTAASIFYKTNELKGFSSEFIHDEGMLRFKHLFSDNAEDTLTTIFKYDSFQRFNLNIKNSVNFLESFEVNLIFVTKHSPMFSYQIWNSNFQRFDRGRYFHQYFSNIVDEYWNDLINASAFQITYQIEKRKFYSWLKKLMERLPCTITYNQIIEQQYLRPVDRSYLDIIISRLPSNAKYYVECIQSLGTIGEFLLNYYLFEKRDFVMLKKLATRREQSYLISKYFCSMFKFLKKDISLTALNFDPNDFPDEVPVGNQYVAIKTAIITPTKILYEIEEVTVNNRGFRKCGPEMFLQIKFRDEDMTPFPRDTASISARIGDSLINGISVGEKMYFDFGSSSSLFRQHGTYFLEANNQNVIVDIIDEWAEFKREPAAKLAARFGLFFSSATEIQFKLRSDEIGWLEEYVSPPHGPQYTFSDGIGIIDVRLARQIQRELGLPTMPSAFQFRSLGCKGMVAIDPYNQNLVSNGGKYLVMFRDSQMKFKTRAESEIDFDVIKYSAPCPLKLHRSFIALLVALAKDQGRWQIVERRIHELFTDAFIDILKSFYDTNAFSKALRGLPKHFPIDKFYPEQLIQEPFFRSIVEVNAVSLSKQLNSKCQIPLPTALGRTVLGVLDETGTLQPGEVFFQYTEDVYSKSENPQLIVHQGKIGITKSPMFHLGDIRYATAVDNPYLYHHKDVIVFCNYGDRPLPDEIGGGDLDGDTFSVFWDPAFMLDHVEAADYPSPDTSYLQKVTVDELHHAHATFRMDYEQYNNLEQISNCYISHLALHHPDHVEVEKLAKNGDVAVNSFKSGVFADPIQPQQKPVYFPAFMNKRHEPSFQSSHILNNVHKRCAKIYLMVQLVQDNLCKKRMDKNVIEFEASEYTRNMYERYSLELTHLMDKFNVKTEAELFANVTLDSPGNFNSFKVTNKNEETTQEIIQTSLSKIIHQFRTTILNEFKPDWEYDMHERNETLSTYVIPTYQVSNEMRILGNEFQQLSENGKFLSFQYLIIEALNFPLNTNVNRSVTDHINNLIADYTSSDISNRGNQKELIATEALLIQLAFSPVPSTFNEPFLNETIISYPSFVISVPSFYSEDFKSNFQRLKDICGVQDVAVRLRKTKGNFHHFTVACEGTLESCIKVEEKLTPYLPYEFSSLSFMQMRRRKTRAMQDILEDVFGFTPPPLSLHHSQTTPARLNAPNQIGYCNENQQNNIDPRFGNENHERHATV